MSYVYDYPRFKVTTAVVIKDADTGRVLILKRAPESLEGNKWCLPGGNLEEGQSVMEAVVAEVMEETGIQLFLDEMRVGGVIDDIHSGNDWERSITVVFLVDMFMAEKYDIKLDKESIEYMWVDPENIQDYSVAFGHERFIN